MCCRGTELVRNKFPRPFRNKVPTNPFDHLSLAGCRSDAELHQVLIAGHAIADCAFVNDPHHPILQRLPARDNYSDADSAFRGQPLKILQIPVKERILVVPLDF